MPPFATGTFLETTAGPRIRQGLGHVLRPLIGSCVYIPSNLSPNQCKHVSGMKHSIFINRRHTLCFHTEQDSEYRKVIKRVCRIMWPFEGSEWQR